MPGLNRRRRTKRLAALTGAALLAAGCSSPARPPSRPAPASQVTTPPVTEHVAHGRFTVVLSAQAVREARTVGVNLSRLVAQALARINALLPGPRTTIAVNYNPPARLITQTGTGGVTDPVTGQVVVAFGRTPQASLDEALKFWLPRTLSHEVDHSVRILAGPRFGVTLLQQTISEGISSVFDEAAFPGPPNPWDRAISPAQECILWKKAQPLLLAPGLYNQWMFGGSGVPHWTAFTIGYDIVKDYRHRHPRTSWAALTSAAAPTILSGSHYQPCPH